MDRIDAMRVFVAVMDEGSLAGAARKLRRSPAAVSRGIAFLEAHVGVHLLYRTTRSIRLSETGERYLAACRRVLADLEDADQVAGAQRGAPRGMLTLSAPTVSGEEIVSPMLDAFLDAHPEVSARLLLLNRHVNLVDEGIDVALRVADLPDSSLIAIRVGGGVRRVIVASPGYLASHPPIEEPADLACHEIIAFTHLGLDSWTFPPAEGSAAPRSVQFTPRLIVNSVRAAVASAMQGRGLARIYSYHVAEQVQDGRLEIVLQDCEHPPLPVHLIAPEGRLSDPKVRAFIDFAVPRLRAQFARYIPDAAI